MMAVDWDIDQEDGGDFYSRWRQRCNYRRGNRKGRWGEERRTTRRWSVLRQLELSTFCREEKAGGLLRGGDVGWKGIGG